MCWLGGAWLVMLRFMKTARWSVAVGNSSSDLISFMTGPARCRRSNSSRTNVLAWWCLAGYAAVHENGPVECGGWNFFFPKDLSIGDSPGLAGRGPGRSRGRVFCFPLEQAKGH